MDRDPLDALIDATARELTTGEPSPALRERVGARISRPRAWWQVPAWQPTVALAAATVVAAVVFWPGKEAIAPSPVPASAPLVAELPLVPEMMPAPKPEAPAVARPARRAPPLVGAMAALEPAAPPTVTPTAIGDDMEPLLLTPLDIAPLTMTVVANDPNVPMPLRIEGLSINPLTLEE